jgi:acetyltransferase (GNAT) family protein
MEKALTLTGASAKRTAMLEFYRCPGCGHAQEAICWGPNKKAQCYSCNRKFPKSAFTLVNVKRAVVTCRECGAEVSLTSANFGIAGLGFICSGCGNYVAVCYGTQAVDPTEVLRPAWNPLLRKRSEEVDRDSAFARCRTKKDFLTVQVLQVMAKEEDSRFMFVRDGEQSAGLLLDQKTGKYLGFIVWNVSAGHAILCQIFIVPDERRRGLAERLVVYWVTRYADELSDTFGVESPNDKASNLHIKLGHMVKEGDGLKGIKCFFAPSF